MKSKIQLVHSVFGFMLPNFELYKTSANVKEIQKEEGGITYPPKWEHTGGTLLPQEFEPYLPKEGMTPELATKQLDVCSSLARGWENDSYKLHSQETMMQLIKTAVINCICLASKDFGAWVNKEDKKNNFLLILEKEMNIFNDAFSRQRPRSYDIEEEMRFAYLKLLLENDYPLESGSDYGDGDYRYNTLYENLYSIFIQRNRLGNERMTRSVSRMIQKKCYDFVVELEASKVTE